MLPMHLATPGLMALDAAQRQVALEVRVLLTLLREPPDARYGEQAMLQMEALALLGDGDRPATADEMRLAEAYLRQLRQVREIEARTCVEAASPDAAALADRIAHAIVGKGGGR